MSEPPWDMMDDAVEEKRARWIFNLVVFLLIFPFTIDLSFMTNSLIPVGVGLSLIAWRVARTPEITGRISSHVNTRQGRFLRNLGIALGTAPILLGVSVYATWDPHTASQGFPFSITYLRCFGPGSPLGCLAYDPVLVVLNYLFWVGLSVIVLSLAGWIRNRTV